MRFHQLTDQYNNYHMIISIISINIITPFKSAFTKQTQTKK